MDFGLRRSKESSISYAYKADLIDRPVRFGVNFSRPSAKSIRKQRTPRMFEAAEIRTMLDNAGPTLRAMVFLGVNCGFGCADVGRLPRSAIDLQAGWVTFPRPKTKTERKIPFGFLSCLDSLFGAASKSSGQAHGRREGQLTAPLQPLPARRTLARAATLPFNAHSRAFALHCPPACWYGRCCRG